MFYISAAIYAFGAIFFLAFSTGVKQPWADVNGYDSLSNANDDDLSMVDEEEGQDELKVDRSENNQTNDEKKDMESYEMKGL